MYGSILSAVTESPRAFKMRAIEDEAIPLPTPDITPPVTNMYFRIFMYMAAVLRRRLA
jgi:hypothetical protein